MIHDYNPNISVEEYKNALRKIKLTKTEILILHALFASEKHTATGLELQERLTKSQNGRINLTFANIAKKVANSIGKFPVSKTNDDRYRWWSLLAIGEEIKDGLFTWQLRPELVEALRQENTLSERFEEPSKMFSLDKVFPVIEKAIREINLTDEWASRDMIVEYLEKKVDSFKLIATETTKDKTWVYGNMVDWFSASLTRDNDLIADYKKEIERKKVESISSKNGKKRKVWAYRISAFRTTEEVVGLAKTFFEGSVSKVTVNRYERDATARQKCIDYHGLDCTVCGINFELIYGDLGRGFIHVHHKKELNSIGYNYEVNPLEDLVPVCPNCHAMLHKKNPAFTIDELRKIVKKRITFCISNGRQSAKYQGL